MLPLYRSVRDSQPGLVPAGDPYMVQVGAQAERAQLFRVTGAGPGPEVYAIEHPDFYDRPGIYGEPTVDYPDNARRFAFFCSRRWRRCPRFVAGPDDPARTRLAHGAGPGLPADHARRAPGHVAGGHRARRCTTPGIRATSPRRSCRRSACRGASTPTSSSSGTGKRQPAEGGLTHRRPRDDGQPDPRARSSGPPGRLRAAGGVRRARATASSASLNGIDQSRLGSRRPIRRSRPRTRPDDFEGKERCKAALQRAFGLPQRKRTSRSSV